MSSPRRVVIIGALSAVMEATARLFAEQGAEILITGRKEERLGALAADLKVRGAARVETAALDLADADADAMARNFATRLGSVDHIVLGYGVLGDQKLAERDLAYAAQILDVDFRSASLWCLAFAQILEEQRRGSLVVIGSVAGDRGRQSNYVYGAAKGGLGILVQGLAHRLAKVGARAVLIKPGFIDSPMTRDFKKGPLWAKPAAIAQIVHNAATKGGPIVYAPSFWFLVMLTIRATPAAIFHKTKL